MIAARRYRGWIAAAVLLGGATAAADPPASQKLLYRWVDAQGHVHYGDRIPPEAVHQEYAEVDGTGRTRKEVEREKSAQELESAQRNEQAAQQKAAYDRYLIETYPTLNDLKASFETQLQSLDQRSANAKRSLSENQATLTDLNSRRASAEAEGSDAVAKLQQQIDSFEASRAQTTDVLNKIEIERKASITRFDSDVQRYRVLTGAAPADR